MGRVQDQVAIVTGAGRGLGEAISYRLAQEAVSYTHLTLPTICSV